MKKCPTMYDGRPVRYCLVSWIGSFTGVLSIFAITYAFELIPGLKGLGLITENWVVGSAGAFGAQSVLVFALPGVAPSQPWNCVMGSIISSFIGVSFRKIFVAVQQLNCTDELIEDDFNCNSDAVRPNLLFLASALANSISIVAMHLTDSMHPPAGAFAYIAINASSKIRSLGYLYMILPVGIGCLWFVTWAWIVNKYINMAVDRLFGVNKEKADQIELNDRQINNSNGKDKPDPVPSEESDSKNTTINVTMTENKPNDLNTIDSTSTPVKKVKLAPNLANRKYPSGDGIGGWLRPLRK